MQIVRIKRGFWVYPDSASAKDEFSDIANGKAFKIGQ
jgi:hypothetical protein